jgi:hypothetical protein
MMEVKPLTDRLPVHNRQSDGSPDSPVPPDGLFGAPTASSVTASSRVTPEGEPPDCLV